MIQGKDYSGADLFRGSLRKLRATYIGYLGYMEEWYQDNPDLTGELLNMCGYWFFPKSVSHNGSAKIGEPLEFSVEWMNKGVSRAYDKYLLWAKLEGENKQHIIQLDNAKPDYWLPDNLVLEKYRFNLPEDITAGEYKLKIKLTTDEETNRPVQLGLQKQIMDNEGFYELFLVNISKLVAGLPNITIDDPERVKLLNSHGPLPVDKTKMI
ncbi:DUF4832 domain-containing protein [Aquiflexum sp.]|uniref:DUF4832 domain-containing protein n=1 Tax=Aquiflexum sp. TaxID=1872584 RepID=UPI0035944661